MKSLRKRLIQVKLSLEINWCACCPSSVFSNQMLSSLGDLFFFLIFFGCSEYELNLTDRALSIDLHNFYRKQDKE